MRGTLFNNQQSIGVGTGAGFSVAGAGRANAGYRRRGSFLKLECSHDASAVGALRTRVRGRPAVRCPFSSRGWAAESSELELCNEIELKSLILAQIERWRHALHMQVERVVGQPAIQWRTGE